MIITKPLCEKITVNTTMIKCYKTVYQDVCITLNKTRAGYTVIRELHDGSNISDVENHFSNLPYLNSEGKECYDPDLYLLEQIFTSNNEDYSDLDQWLWEMEPGETIEETITLNITDDYGNIHDKEVNIKICLLNNEITGD